MVDAQVIHVKSAGCGAENRISSGVQAPRARYVSKMRFLHAKVYAIGAFLLFSSNAAILSAQDGGAIASISENEVYICPETGRLLPDEEILDIILNHERSLGRLPQQVIDRNITDLREYRPSCCSVLREDNPYNRYRGWLSHLFESRYILVIVGWDDPAVIVPRTITTYEVSLCGIVNRRQGSTTAIQDQ